MGLRLVTSVSLLFHAPPSRPLRSLDLIPGASPAVGRVVEVANLQLRP
jgi:hypothetical protein